MTKAKQKSRRGKSKALTVERASRCTSQGTTKSRGTRTAKRKVQKEEDEDGIEETSEDISTKDIETDDEQEDVNDNDDDDVDDDSNADNDQKDSQIQCVWCEQKLRYAGNRERHEQSCKAKLRADIKEKDSLIEKLQEKYGNAKSENRAFAKILNMKYGSVATHGK